MRWQEWLGSLLVLIGLGGGIILLAEALCGLLKLDRKRPEPEEFQDVDAYFARVDDKIRAQAARIAKCEVRR